MRFGEAVRSGFSHYVDTSGRASRSAFWWWLLYVSAPIAIFPLISLALMGGVGYWTRLATLFAVLWFLLPTATVMVRRLHDMNRSGQWLLIALVPVLGVVVLLVLALMPGTSGPNRYGVTSDGPGQMLVSDAIPSGGLVGKLRGLVTP